MVVRCKERRTGKEVAAKLVWRDKQSAAATQAEYRLLARLGHPSLPRAYALLSCGPGRDAIVMERWVHINIK
jgi:aminoglycoside phosphotransferase (APT) family kinase protein